MSAEQITPEQPVLFFNGAYVYTAGPLDAYAWPGGYAIVYYPVDENGSTTGDVLCAKCANAELNDPEGRQPAECAGYIAECSGNHDYERDITCDNCYTTIVYQTYCDFCQDSVDVDEDHPHVCKPLKWALQYRYQNTGLPPSVSRYATREQARSMARHYRNRGYQMVNVHPIVPPIMPE